MVSVTVYSNQDNGDFRILVFLTVHDYLTEYGPVQKEFKFDILSIILSDRKAFSFLNSAQQQSA
jgi:hypothetical protein